MEFLEGWVCKQKDLVDGGSWIFFQEPHIAILECIQSTIVVSCDAFSLSDFLTSRGQKVHVYCRRHAACDLPHVGI